MISDTDMSKMIGATAFDNDGDKIGKIGMVFLDDQTGQPEFVTINTGFFGTSESFVPAAQATMNGGDVTLPFDKDTIKGAPKVDDDHGHIDQASEQTLYEYYGMGYDRGHDAVAAGTVADGVDFDSGHDTSGPTTDDAMTRSEEHLVAGTTTQESGRARLRKYVTTEQESVTVPVRKERAVLTSEPITEANMPAAGAGPAISEEEHEVVLHEERATVQAVAKPVERVALGTETVVSNETVTGDVRKENIELEGDIDSVDQVGKR